MPRPTSRHDNGMSARYSRSRRRDRRTALRTTMARAIWEVGRNWSSQGSRIPAMSMSHTDKMARIPALPQARVAHNPSGADGAVTDRADASAAEVRYASGTLMSDMGGFSEFEWVWPARTVRRALGGRVTRRDPKWMGWRSREGRCGSGPAAHPAPRLLMPAGQRRVPPSGAILPTRRSRCRLSAAGAAGAHETTDSVDGVRARRLDEEGLPILPEHGNPDRMRHFLIEISVRPEATVSRFGSRRRHEIEHDPELTAGESPDLGLARWIETR